MKIIGIHVWDEKHSFCIKLKTRITTKRVNILVLLDLLNLITNVEYFVIILVFRFIGISSFMYTNFHQVISTSLTPLMAKPHTPALVVAAYMKNIAIANI